MCKSLLHKNEDKARYSSKIANFDVPLAFDAPVIGGGGVPDGVLPHRLVNAKTDVPTRRLKSLRTFTDLTEYRRVTDGRTDRKTSCDGIVHAIHSIAR